MPDEKVQAAINNWAPRFTSQGVDYNDFFRTTARIEKWEDWCREWVATGDVHHDLAVKAEATGEFCQRRRGVYRCGIVLSLRQIRLSGFPR